MADIFLGVYRDNKALGQRVWPPQIDSASCACFCALRFLIASSMASRRFDSSISSWPHCVYHVAISRNLVGDSLPIIMKYEPA